MKDEKIIGVLLLGAGAWYLYTRSQGLTLTGQPEHPMLTADRERYLSPVTPSYSTGTQATNTANLAASLSTLVNKVVGIFNKPKPGNAPQVPSNSFAVAANTPPEPAGNFGVPSIGSQPLVNDPSLNNDSPFWQWDLNFDAAPLHPDYGGLAWTLPPDASYIPPPPGMES